MAVRMAFGYYAGFFGKADSGSAFDYDFVSGMKTGENLGAYTIALSYGDGHFPVPLFVKLYVHEVIALLLG